MPKKRRRQPRFKTPENCPLCTQEIEPNYKDYKTLAKFLSDRSKIVPSERTGMCTRHQRLLAREIKRARHLGLLPFSPTV